MRAERAAAHHARVFERDGEIVLQVVEAGLVLRLSGEDVREAVLRDGDVIELGERGPRLRLEAGDDAGRGDARGGALGARGLARLDARARRAELRPGLPAAARRCSRSASALALATVGYSQLQDRKLRHEVEHLREALRRVRARARAASRARIAEERERGGDGPGGALRPARRAAPARGGALRADPGGRRGGSGGAARASSGDARASRDARDRARGGRAHRARLRPGRVPDPGRLPVPRRGGPAAALQARRQRQRAEGRRRQPAARPRGAGPGARGRVRRHRLPGRPARPGADEPPHRRAVVERRARAVARRARLHREADGAARLLPEARSGRSSCAWRATPSARTSRSCAATSRACACPRCRSTAAARGP